MMTGDPIKWLETDRGLDGALLAAMGIQRDPKDRLGPNTLAFPYVKSGKTYAAKMRTVDKRFTSTQGVSRGLYNIDALTKDLDRPVVITEGEIDCLSVIQAGFLRAVSIPDGWTAQGNKTQALIDAETELRRSPYVIVAGDADEAGESLPRAVANLLRGHDVRFVTWPEGCKDANDVLVAFGEGKLSDCLQAAQRLDPPGGFITSLIDLPPMSRRRVLRTGIEWLDGRVAFELGAMSVGTGTPGAGKSTMTTFIAHHVAKHERIRVGMMSFETHPHRTRDHLCRLSIGKPFDEIDSVQAARFFDETGDLFRIVHRTFDDVAGHNLGWLESMIYTLAVRDECKWIIIDPWNELEHMPDKGESLTNYINFALQRIRQLAESLEVHITVIAHPKKMDFSRDNRPPFGYDIADSASFANKPSLGFSVHQNVTEEGIAYSQLFTWKVRDTQLYGIEKGFTDCRFDKFTMSYSRLDPMEARA
jgi:twinkle protein